MIKIEKRHDCKSFFRKDDIYDSKRDREFKISIFGIVLFKRDEHYSCDLKDNNEKNNCGFK